MSSSPDETLVLSPLATLGTRRADGRVEIELTEARGRARFVVGPGIGRLLVMATAPATRSELIARLAADAGLPVTDVESMVDALTAARVLCAPSAEDDDLWLRRGWRAARVYERLTADVEYLEDSASRETKLERLAGYLDDEAPPALWMQRPGEVVELPDAEPVTAPAGPTMLRRRTFRQFDSSAGPSLQQIATLASLACQPAAAIRAFASEHLDENPYLLTLSSYTALELYVLVRDVEGLDDGAYHYDMRRHRLTRVRPGRHLDELQAVAIGQVYSQLRTAMVITGVPERTMWRYRDARALRTIYIEAGSLCHRLLLIAEALGWHTFMTPAIRDREAEALLDLAPNEELALYTVGFGRPTG